MISWPKAHFFYRKVIFYLCHHHVNVSFKCFATASFQKQIYTNYLKLKKCFSVSTGVKLVSKF
jgi:hypothetical protein